MIRLKKQSNRAERSAQFFEHHLAPTNVIGIFKKITNGREVWAIADQALVSGTNFLTNIIVARSLGLSEFGVFALAWMAILFFYTVQLSGIVAPMMSLGPKTSPTDRPQYFGAVIVQELCFLGVCVGLLYFGLQMMRGLDHRSILSSLTYPILGAMVAFLFQDFLRRYFFTTRQSFRAFLIDLVSYIPQLPLIVLAVRKYHIHTPGVLWIIALTSLTGVVIGLYWFERIDIDSFSLRRTLARQWMISRWLAPSAVLWWTSTNFFVVVAPVYYGAMAAGVLRASQNLVGACNIWFLGLENVIPAETSRLLNEEGPSSSASYLRSVILKWGLITLVFVSILGLAPNFWLSIFYGSKYAGYGYLLRLYGISYIFVFTGLPLRAGLQAVEHTSPIFWTYVMLTAISLTTAVPLTKWLGLRGVVLGSIFVQIIFQCILLACLIRRFRALSTKAARRV